MLKKIGDNDRMRSVDNVKHRNGLLFLKMTQRIAHIFRIGLVALLAVWVSGCIGLVLPPFRPSPGPKIGPQMQDLAEAFDVVCRNYRLGPDDVLQLIFQTEWNIPAGSYKLDSLDVIDVFFPLLPPDERRLDGLTIRPDGMISVPGIGDVKAAGLSPEQLARDIERRLREADIFREGGESGHSARKYQLCTVSVNKFYQKVSELVKSLTTLTSGQQSQLTVKPDGTIDLPPYSGQDTRCRTHSSGGREDGQPHLPRGRMKHVVASVSLNQAKARNVYVPRSGRENPELTASGSLSPRYML